MLFLHKCTFNRNSLVLLLFFWKKEESRMLPSDIGWWLWPHLLQNSSWWKVQRPVRLLCILWIWFLTALSTPSTEVWGYVCAWCRNRIAYAVFQYQYCEYWWLCKTDCNSMQTKPCHASTACQEVLLRSSSSCSTCQRNWAKWVWYAPGLGCCYIKSTENSSQESKLNLQSWQIQRQFCTPTQTLSRPLSGWIHCWYLLKLRRSFSGAIASHTTGSCKILQWPYKGLARTLTCCKLGKLTNGMSAELLAPPSVASLELFGTPQLLGGRKSNNSEALLKHQRLLVGSRNCKPEALSIYTPRRSRLLTPTLRQLQFAYRNPCRQNSRRNDRMANSAMSWDHKAFENGNQKRQLSCICPIQSTS